MSPKTFWIPLALIWLAFIPSAMSDDARPLWLRYPAVSPDGKTIAFCYSGQIWLVASAGGDAVPLTGSNFYCKTPVWSPDGRRIAFASTRHGNDDVYVMPALGGEIYRLTHHSAPDVPMAFSPDGNEVWFHSTRIGDPVANGLDSLKGLGPLGKQVYAVNSSGGRPRMTLPTPALSIAWHPSGQHFLYDVAWCQIENEWRKHQVSDAARDIWAFETTSGKHRQLTQWQGEDRNPIWDPSGDSMLWLSERGGSFNVWKRPLEGGEPQQVTRHGKWPVRFLTAANDGTLVYAYNGEIWRKPADGGDAEVVSIRIRQGSLVGGETVLNVNKQVTDFALSQDGSQIALIARGEVFVVSTEDGSTRRITTTAAMERSPAFAPDGRHLAYASERNGTWDIYQARLTGKEDHSFAKAAPFEEKLLIGGEDDTDQPVYSPQGDRVAYYHNRTAIRIHDLSNGTSIEVQPADASYSYYDNDLHFSWAPNGRWLLTQTGFGQEIALVDATGETPRQNVSLNGFGDYSPDISADGQIAYWLSDRKGLRTASFDPAEGDVYAAFLTPAAFRRFRNGEGAADEQTVNDPQIPNVEKIDLRTIRLTPFSSQVQFFRLTPDNKQLIVVLTQPNGTMVAYSIDTKSHAPRTIFTEPAQPGAIFATDAKVTTLFMAAGGSLARYDLASGKKSVIPFNAEMVRDARAEIIAIYDHCWRLTANTFYRPDMHGIDWGDVGAHYRRFLPHIIHWEDLSQLLEEMVGELNASHHAALYRASNLGRDETAALGLYYDQNHRGPGMKVTAVLPGSPADQASDVLRPGATILTVDGVEITPDTTIHRLLNRKAGKTVRLEIMPADGGAIVSERLTPITFLSGETSLVYERWLDSRRDIVEQLSDGRIGYIHLRVMKLPEFQRAFGDLFGRYLNAEAVIVDIRSNGGGNMHDQLIAMLTGQHDSDNVSRDGVVVRENPATRWAKPSAVLVSANSYSDGSVFPTLYQRKKIGPIVGERVPGTGTAVIRDPQIDPHMTYGVPELGFRLTDGTYFENFEVVPDVLIYNDPESVAAGRDLQLEKAVEVLMKQLGKK